MNYSSQIGLNNNITASILFIEEGTPIKSLNIYTDGISLSTFFEEMNEKLVDEPENPLIRPNVNPLIQLYMYIALSLMNPSGRTVVFTERNDSLYTVCIEEENIGSGITAAERASLRKDNPFEPNDYEGFDLNDQDMAMPYLYINNNQYEIVNNYSVLIDSGEDTSYLVAAMRNTINPDFSTSNIYYDYNYYFGIQEDISCHTITDGVINPGTRDEFVRLTERMPYVILSQAELEYAGTKETTDTPDRANREGEPEEESITHNPYFTFKELTDEELTMIQLEYPALYDYIEENYNNGYTYIYVVESIENILDKDNYHILKHTPKYGYYVNPDNPSQILFGIINANVKGTVYAELNIEDVYYIGEEMPSEKNVEFKDTPDSPNISVKIKKDTNNVPEVTEEGRYTAEATVEITDADGNVLRFVLKKDFDAKKRPVDTDSDESPDQPNTDSDNPNTDSDNPNTDSDNPNTDSDNPNTDSDNPNTDSDKPNTDSDKPNTDSDQPNTDSDQPNTDSDQPNTDSDNPNTDSDQPNTDSEKKETDSDESPDHPTDIEPKPGKKYLMGDVDFDGKITAKDSLLIMRDVIKLQKFNTIQSLVADVNNDGKVTNADAMVILRYTIKLPVSGSVGKEVVF